MRWLSNEVDESTPTGNPAEESVTSPAALAEGGVVKLVFNEEDDNAPKEAIPPLPAYGDESA